MIKKGSIWLVVVVFVLLLGAGVYYVYMNRASADVASGSITSSFSSVSAYKYVIEGRVATDRNTFGPFDLIVNRGLSEEAGKKVQIVPKQNATTLAIIGDRKQTSRTFYKDYDNYIESTGLKKGDHLFIAGERVYSNGQIFFIADSISLTVPYPSATVTPTQ